MATAFPNATIPELIASPVVYKLRICVCTSAANRNSDIQDSDFVWLNSNLGRTEATDFRPNWRFTCYTSIL